MRKPNRHGCVPSEDVCLQHCEPLTNRHGCSEQKAPPKIGHRQPLKALARSRGYLAATLAADVSCWVGRAWMGHDGVEVLVRTPTRVATDRGLRAALEALPEVRSAVICRDLCGDLREGKKQ